MAQVGTAPTEQRIHMDDPDASQRVAATLYEYGLPLARRVDEIVVLCIGTDRSIGDALGPLIGSQLVLEMKSVDVLGTLDNPVHASNLADTIDELIRTRPNAMVIAIDACLGRMESVGVISVGRGALKPGAGVNKTLPAVGDLYLTGVVNVGGFMEYFVLQNTRLSLVTRMAQVISKGLIEGLSGLLTVQGGAAGEVLRR